MSVEVKASHSFVGAAYLLSPGQQAQLCQAAMAPMVCHEDLKRSGAPFDVALAVPGGIKIIEDVLRLN